MARDIGAMKAFGPNPHRTVMYIKNLLKHEAGIQTDITRKNRIIKNKNMFQTAWDNYNGRANSPIDASVANTGKNVRGVLAGAQLGTAVFSAISDTALGRIAAAHAGLNQARLIKRAASRIVF